MSEASQKIAFMFSGQGSQHAGMCKELYDNFPVCKEVFCKADEVLNLPLTDIMFNNDERLNETEYTQPALLTMGLAIFRLFEERGIKPQYVLGLSLGEYTALTASGAFSFEDAVCLVRKRGRFMTEAVPKGKGAMLAVMNLDRKIIEEVCAEVTQRTGKFVTPANYNTPGQIVVAGEKEAVEESVNSFLEKGAKRCIPLNVNGPFHTKLMQPASVKLEEELKKIQINPMSIPVITNVTGQVIPSTESIVPTLIEQVKGPVRWEECVTTLTSNGVDLLVELGPGKTLCSFAKHTGKTICNVEDMKSFEKTMSIIQG